MNTAIKIALEMPDQQKASRQFTFRLKSDLDNELSEYPSPKKTFVVSDIEGNFTAFCKLLIKGKVIDRHLKWTFEDNHLVIVGDCFDRGEQVTECLWLIYSLEEKARQKGGYVHFILGNHEIMNMNGDWRYVHPKYAENTRTQLPITALYGGNNELWRWLCTKNIIEKIGNVLFVHAGIAGEFIQVAPTIKEINEKARRYYTRAHESFTDPLLSVIFNSQNSPFWFRGYYDGTTTEEQVNAALSHFRVNTIVTGHTISNQVNSYFNGKVINVNTDHAAGISEGLLIRRNRFYRLTVGGNKEKIK
jgi:hypothetical protein